MNIFKGNWNRRRFVQTAGSIAALNVAEGPMKLVTAANHGVSIIVDSSNTAAGAAPALWAADELESTLTANLIKVSRHDSLRRASSGDVCILVTGTDSGVAQDILKRAVATVAPVPESLAIATGQVGGKKVVLCCGSDTRGIVYALLELADRVKCASNPITGLEVRKPFLEKPANRVRSVNRCFQSDVEDKPWFNDRKMWSAYLTMLISNRFNRFNLSLGLGYDYPQVVSDTYLYFTYPFLLDVPGYKVRANPLSDEERDNNLEMLRFISTEAAARGLDFQLGLWNHAYVMPKDSKPTYNIEGLTPENHAHYCRDALYALLKACPGISGLTLRVHGESGIPEGNFDFWDVVFQGIGRLDRKIEVNMHAKGISQRMIDIAAATKMPMTLSPKYWGEHLGLPYQPSSIRELEMPPPEPTKGGFFELSSGARRVLRYSYGDLIKKSRPYDVFFRIWPGTQRTLLWGDPKLAAGDGRAMTICGSLGVDLFEPLSFKARGGSGIAGPPGVRCSYADSSLTPRFDWAKFLYSYRVWGRHIYNPDADPEGCYRYWDKQLGAAGRAMSQALAGASRVLRIVTTAHEPSAANWTYWPEMYTNMPIVDESTNTLYRDTPAPKVFENVSPLDPQMFSSISECVADLLKQKSDSLYSPIEVAQWLEGYTSGADKSLADAKGSYGKGSSPEFRRAALDVTIQSGLGKFFCAKIRSCLMFSVYEQTGSQEALREALHEYRTARGHWAEVADAAKDTYMEDVTYGPPKHMRGHWLDRLPAIDADIDAMQARLVQAGGNASASSAFDPEEVKRVLMEISSPSSRPSFSCQHVPASTFEPGKEQAVELRVAEGGFRLGNGTIRLKYRHVNQGEHYQTAQMDRDGSAFHTVIPAGYTRSEYALQYYFELDGGPGQSTMYPGLGPDHTNQPYFIVEQA